MECDGQHISSTTPHMTINFRTSDNNEEILKIPNNFQIISKGKNTIQCKITSKIFNENGAAYILLKSNFCDRPLKLLIDTGASITLLANDLAPNNVNIINYTIKLSGVVRDISIETCGMLHATFDLNGNKLETVLHLVDRKHSGPADGYLGYDILSTYKTIIDMNEMKIVFNLKSETIETKWHPLEETIENPEFADFLKTLGNSYDFVEFEEENCQKAERINRIMQRKSNISDNKRINRKDQRKAEKWNRHNVAKKSETINGKNESSGGKTKILIEPDICQDADLCEIREKIKLKNELCNFIEDYQNENRQIDDEIDWYRWSEIQKEVKRNTAVFYRINEKYEDYSEAANFLKGELDDQIDFDIMQREFSQFKIITTIK